ncbi:methylcrotonoyl-CoA carboxylase beta chain, mitochondrial-like isoform X2 [Limulus polyphemus]|uniref:methylcrotonoyl-CoA carboxylase n=1 Tax=Limulus polyphemus TaxID=6850 RepID=A0ABM1T0D0_LIMPO|nr:methylcrotonoyl-CoA carboxylase beta chain, mitochondrial-like isoform X2 [Limulus polyphemus]
MLENFLCICKFSMKTVAGHLMKRMRLSQAVKSLQLFPGRCVSTFNKHFKMLKGEVDTKNQQYIKGLEHSMTLKQQIQSILSKVKSGGGEKAIHRHTIVNKKIFVRERLKMLFDEDCEFLEIGALAGLRMNYGDVPAAGLVLGIGKIHGKWGIVAANDGTVKGGAMFPVTVAKMLRAQRLALQNFLPTVYLVDSGGGFLTHQAELFPDQDHGGRVFRNEAVLASRGIPQISVVCGPCTAGGAYCPTMTQEAIIVKGIGTLYLGGPPLVKAAIQEEVTEEELGGADLHCRLSGCLDYYAENEEEALSVCRDIFLTLNMENIQTDKSYSQPVFSVEELPGLAGQKSIAKDDLYKILARLLDGSVFQEFKEQYGSNLITGFGNIHGFLVGILANCGPVSSADALKGSHFIQLCNHREIPLVFLQNFASQDFPESGLEKGLVLKDRANMIAAHACATVPKITINMGGSVGDHDFIMCGWSFEPNFLFSWPSAQTHSNYHRETGNSMDDGKKATDPFLQSTSAFSRSANMLQDGIIFPEDTRQVLGTCLEIACVGYRRSRMKKVQTTSAVLRM